VSAPVGIFLRSTLRENVSAHVTVHLPSGKIEMKLTGRKTVEQRTLPAEGVDVGHDLVGQELLRLRIQRKFVGSYEQDETKTAIRRCSWASCGVEIDNLPSCTLSKSAEVGSTCSCWTSPKAVLITAVLF
jgi:hypothetical protein